MSGNGSEFYDSFTKDIFETIKGLSDDSRGEFIINTYENLYGKLKDDTERPRVNVDLVRLREDLGNIRGIGGQRLDEIMAVIGRHLGISGNNRSSADKQASNDNTPVPDSETDNKGNSEQ